MLPIRFLALAAVIAALTLSRASAFGPGYNEQGDAGSVKGTAQPVKGASGSPVGAIAGSLSFPFGGPADTEDMYIIRIDDPVGFSAATGASTLFDSQLWLFQYDTATGLLGNNNVAPGVFQSRISPPANDGTGQTIPGAGFYLLAISANGNVPLSVDGPIFQFGNAGEISGPDGPGGSSPHTAWSGDGDNAADYVIHVQGVTFIPESGIPTASEWTLIILTVALIGVGAWTARRRAALAFANQ